MGIQDPIKYGEEPCKCGRSLVRRHCPKCGSATGYAIKKLTKRINPQSGSLQEYQTYRCRNCNLYYDELQWQSECQAPLFISRLSEKRRDAENNVLAGKLPSGLDQIGIQQAIKLAKAQAIKAGAKKLAELKPEDSSVIIKDGKPIFKITGLGD
jgi:hypothetical protein